MQPNLTRSMTQRTPTEQRSAATDSAFDTLSASIDRSRKRHLSVGLLRGDLVQDRLLVQESSASPLLKKSKPSPTRPVTPPAENMAMTMAEFREYMDKNTNKNISSIEKRMDSVDGKLTTLSDNVSRIDRSVAENTTKLDEHEAIIKANQRSIANLKSELENGRSAFPPLAAPSQGSLLADARATDASVPTVSDRRAFALARRSVRLWPVPGRTSQELWDAAGIFLGTRLGMEGKLDKSMIDSISRPPSPSGPGVTDEALVAFSDAAARDLVIGAASKLSTFIDAQGKATAGMRIEVPPFLEADFKLLFKYGRTLRFRHGPGTRRHVKFDDLHFSLFLNAKLPGDEHWSRVPLEVARRGLRSREAATNGELEMRFDINGPQVGAGRPRATSLGDPPGRSAPPAATGSIWTRRAGSVSSS